MNTDSKRCSMAILAVMLFSTVFVAVGDENPAPVILTVQGKIGAAVTVSFTAADIMALPPHGFSTVDPWDGKKHEFSGVLLSDVLSSAGIARSATRITAKAGNNYSIPIRRTDLEKFGYLLAWKIDGHLFGDDKSTKNRGFLSIAVNFTEYPELDPELIKHQLVWQLNEITVE